MIQMQSKKRVTGLGERIDREQQADAAALQRVRSSAIAAARQIAGTVSSVTAGSLSNLQKLAVALSEPVPALDSDRSTWLPDHTRSSILKVIEKEF